MQRRWGSNTHLTTQVHLRAEPLLPQGDNSENNFKVMIK